MSDEIEAGRELDALIAEHVMGWEWWRSSVSGRRSLFAPGAIPRGEDEWFCERADGSERLVFDWKTVRIPPYSTEIGAAWAVAEKLKALGRDSVMLSNEGDGWECEITVSDELYAKGWRSASWQGAAPFAICRAALKVVERLTPASSPTTPGAA